MGRSWRHAMSEVMESKLPSTTPAWMMAAVARMRRDWRRKERARVERRRGRRWRAVVEKRKQPRQKQEMETRDLAQP